jgi:hypothetical protein
MSVWSLTLPLLRNGSLPLPLAGEGLGVIAKRYMNAVGPKGEGYSCTSLPESATGPAAAVGSILKTTLRRFAVAR